MRILNPSTHRPCANKAGKNVRCKFNQCEDKSGSEVRRPDAVHWAYAAERKRWGRLSPCSRYRRLIPTGLTASNTRELSWPMDREASRTYYRCESCCPALALAGPTVRQKKKVPEEAQKGLFGNWNSRWKFQDWQSFVGLDRSLVIV